MKNIIVLYPHNSLKEGTKHVTLDYIQTDEFRSRISTMFRLMYYNRGVGLAAPQVGWDAKLFVCNPKGKPEHVSDALVLINPEWIPIDGVQIDEEGCLSVPGIWAPVRRHDKISVKALNEEGFEFEFEASGFLSRIIQHECDHLDGIMMMDRLDSEALADLNSDLAGHIKRVKELRRYREHAKIRRALTQKRKEKEKARAKVKKKKRK